MRKACRRKPRAVLVNPMGYVLAGMTPASANKSAMMVLRLKNHEALDAIRAGAGSFDLLNVVIEAFNTALGLCIVGVLPDRMAEIRAGADALMSLGQRWQRTGSMAFTGEEWKAACLAMSHHDDQLDECTELHIDKARDVVNNTISAKRARVIQAPPNKGQ